MADYRISWIVIALLLIGVQLAIGNYAKGRWLGILIDNRNKYSLSRLQIVAWTTVLVSAFFAVIYHVGTTSIYLPTEVWALMAISTGSAAAAIMIKDNKSQQQPTAAAVANQAAPAAPAAAAVGAAAAPAASPPMGVLTTATEPHLSDMFLGEELVDDRFVDISKVQMIFFTIAAVIGYIAALSSCNLSLAPADLKEHYTLYFPPLSAALVTLVGISHAGYLTVKASPKTPTT